MAGIFNIFNESENRSPLSTHRGKGTSHPLGLSKFISNGSSGLLAAKHALQIQSKPKGLSIRSTSDQNVAVTNNSTVKKLNPKDRLVFKDKSCLPEKKSISPLKMKTPKSKSIANITSKKLSPKMLTPKTQSPKISSPILQNVVDESTVFKKPATPKPQKKTNKCPEPETLAYNFDEYQYMKEEMEQIFNDDRNFLKSVMKSNNDTIVPLEDEGFISDSSFDSFDLSTGLSSSSPSPSNVELPDISDYED